MNQMTHTDITTAASLREAAARAARAIPPAWPLNATVAVNPFAGQSHLSITRTAGLLERLTGERLFMPRQWYLDRIRNGTVAPEDLAEALERGDALSLWHGTGQAGETGGQATAPQGLPDMATLARDASGTDWPRLVLDWISGFAAGYFDEGQALWAAPRGKSLFAAWRLHAVHDLSPEIAGLTGFCADVADLPLTASDVLTHAGTCLGLDGDPGTYFHKLLLELGGYAQYARQLMFSAARDGSVDETLLDLLAVRLVHELCLFKRYEGVVSKPWTEALAAHRADPCPGPDLRLDAALQEAVENAAARTLLTGLEWSALSHSLNRDAASQGPDLQAAFCIDVRSEVFRRALETTDTGIATIGFAGFFGLGVAHCGPGSDVVEHRLPVLLPAGRFSCAEVSKQDDRSIRLRSRAVRAFGRFRQAAVSCFAFVEAMGPVYAGKLLAGSFGLAGSTSPGPRPVFRVELPPEERVAAAEAVLRAMSLTEGFARLVLLAGHGATSANNPFLSALQCGACGGHAGDVNARLLASLLNDPQTRQGLAERGILIPRDTLFLAGLHDTTTDHVELFSGDVQGAAHEAEITRLRGHLEAAGRLARAERAKRLPRGSEGKLASRSRDWAEIRPEWALAGCNSFIAAPRSLTVGKSLEGRSFLHDYVWQKDEAFKVLELILTAPVVVASWINLQYFGSTTMPRLFGSGNKLLHNVVGGIGVVEGNGGVLRTGLAWQSVHDGKSLRHEPLRLTVIIAAPEWAITDILARHPDIKALFDNDWLRLCALGENGTPSRRYMGDLRWKDVNTDLAKDLRPHREAA
nr:DUF2309 domain-containing protein [uncultured Gellertiella sp.]